MTACDEVPQAVERIERRGGREAFTMLEVVDELRRAGTRCAVRRHGGGFRVEVEGM